MKNVKKIKGVFMKKSSSLRVFGYSVMFFLLSFSFFVPMVGLAASSPKTLTINVPAMSMINVEIDNIIKDECKTKCKDFRIKCAKIVASNRADKANGISEKIYVVLEWLNFGGDPNLPYMIQHQGEQKWREKTNAFVLINKNHGWMIQPPTTELDMNDYCGGNNVFSSGVIR
jgi:hypothetical protein